MADGRDRVTVGVTPEGARNIELLMQTGWFADEVDAYRTSIAVAISHGLDVTESNLPGVQTKYNVGTLDRDGRLARLVRGLVDGQPPRPYEYCERLADAGLRYLRSRLVDQGAMLTEVLTGPSREPMRDAAPDMPPSDES
jgi:hypothetical protein